MCGITGMFNAAARPASPVVLQRMTDALAHRGPDGEGLFTDGPVGLGHRRLAIIDLSAAAHQPMQSVDGRFTLTYNGEIYNFRELRAELEARGHQFRSRSDTEVLLHGFAEWGVDILPRLNGMFAFAIWDRRTRQLLLARDRYGIKPLYYATRAGSFLFASEIKSLLCHPDLRCDLDRAGLVEYLTFQNFFTDRTLFSGVRLLPPGCSLVVKAGEIGRIHVERYWDYQFEEPLSEASDPREYVEELDRLFVQAVSRQLVSDVPVSSYLSGGIDSGSITAVAAQQLPELRTFTVGFDLHSASGLELAFDERESAERLSYLNRTEHYEMVLKAGDMERVIPRLVRHLEEPRVGQSYPNFYAAQLASKFAKVVLAGTGGDELFGGYPWRYYRAVINDSFDDYVEKYYGYWQRLIPTAAAADVFRPIASDASGVDTRAIFRDVFTSHATNLTRPEDYINHSLYFEAKTFLHGLLIVDDKLGMAHGLETRVPFLDNDLVDFAMRLPVRHKLGHLGEVVRLNENEPGDKTRRYFERTRDGKIILRKAMERYVPPEVAGAIKQGFSAPDASWFKGESIDFVRRLLYRSDAAIYAYLDRATIQALVDDHMAGRQNRRLLIWSLINLEIWCETFLGAGRHALEATGLR
jgi:asparagine synthase (glutamine-hydrolysing)